MKWPGIITIFKLIYNKSKTLFLKLLLYLISGTCNSLVFLFGWFFIRKGLLRRVILISFSIGFTITAFVVIYGYHVWNQDIDVSKLKEYKPIMSSIVLDKDGNTVNEFANERRIFVPINKVSKHIINAFISAEDRSFYTNSGVDVKGLIRIGIMDVIYFLQGKKLHGASTITQQVVRSTLLSNERTITRKIKEMILSYKISKIMEKNEILEVYLNHIYLGSRSYGVGAAVKEYFGKDASNVTIAEAALIASITKSPSSLDPRKGRQRTLDRRNWVIKSMFEENYISDEEMKNATSDGINLIDKRFVRKPYSYIDYVAYYLSEHDKISMDDLQSKGYTIKTKFDYDIYTMAYKAFNDGIVNYDMRHGYKGVIAKCDNIAEYKKFLSEFDIPDKIGDYKIAVVLDVNEKNAKIGFEKSADGTIELDGVIWARKRLEDLDLGPEIKKMPDVLNVGDVILVHRKEDGKLILAQIPEVDGAVVIANPKDGSIVAMVGGYLDIPGTFNRAFQANRQPGSVAKIFSYLTILENGFKPNDLVIDSDFQISSGNGIAWNPQNDSKIHYDAMTVRRAFERSLNAPLARMMYEVGASKLSANLSKLGVAENVDPVLSSAIGSFDTTLVNIIRGYCQIVNGGRKVEITPISSVKISEFAKIDVSNIDSVQKLTNEEKDIEDITNDIKEIINNGDQVIDLVIAYQLTSMLQGCAIRGTAAKFGAKVGQYSFGKTGTTNDAKDLWFIGGNSEYIVGVYVGYDIPKSLGKREYGGITSLPIAAEIMSNIIKKYPSKPFSVPKDVKFVNIDLETGKSLQKGGFQEAFRASDEIKIENDFTKQHYSTDLGIY